MSAVHELFAQLIVDDGEAAINFYTRAFGAEPGLKLTGPDGHVAHAEMRLGGTTLMLAEEFPELGLTGPRTADGIRASIHLHVDDADAVIARAVEHGATVEMEPRDHSHGERAGAIRDPFGHRWSIGHHLEEVSPEEMQRRYGEESKQ